MSNENVNQSEQPLNVSELDSLKARAKVLGITYNPTIGVDKLRAKVNAKLEGDKPDDTSTDTKPVDKVIGTDTTNPAAVVTPDEIVITQELLDKVTKPTKAQIRTQLKREAGEMLRIRVTCMNPNKKAWEGELFTCANSAVGTFKKFVPFDNEAGWHVPRIIVNMMKAKRCQIFVHTKDKRGRKVTTGKLIREFAIEILDPLTAEALSDLKQQQAMSGSIDKVEE